MTNDVFISYAREDNVDGFVNRLFDALEAEKLNVWMDNQDIPPSFDFQEEIQAGIRAADFFLFVLTPNSVNSRHCSRELEHAISYNKRLIPVLRSKTPSDSVTNELRRLNWIYFLNDDEFDTAFARVMQTINTEDQTFVHTHTRLLRRALEWEENTKNASFLLRGDDLTEAETWLASSGNRDPRPTDLQTQYILASREGQNLRQRNLLVGVTAALVVTVVLAILSFILFGQSQANLQLAEENAATADANAIRADNNAATSESNAILAENNAATAVYQSGISRSVALAAQAQLEMEGRLPERAVLLALEALENYPYTFQAERALSEALQASHARLILRGHTDVVNDAQWSPDGTRIASVSNDQTTRIWDVAMGEVLFTLEGHTALVYDVAWSADSTRLLTASADDTVRVWDTATGEELMRLQMPVSDIMDETSLAVVWSPDEAWIVGTNAQGATVWDATSGEEQYNVPALLAWTNGERIFTQADDFVTHDIWEVATGENIPVGELDSVDAVAWSSDGERLVALNWYGASLLINLQTGAVDGTFDDDILWQISEAAWSPDDTTIVVGGEQSWIQMWDVAQLGLYYDSILSGTEYISAIAWSPDGTRFTTADGNQVRVWDTEGREELLRLRGHDSFIIQTDWSPDGRQLLTVSYDDTIRVWSGVTGGDPLVSAGGMGLLDNMMFSPDGDKIAISSLLDDTVVQDVATDETLFAGIGQAVTWSPDGIQLLTISNWDGVGYVWDITQEDPLMTFDTGYEALDFDFGIRRFVAAWSPDGTRIATLDRERAFAEGAVFVRDADTGDVLVQFDEYDSAVQDIAWSPDGARIATVYEDGFADIWNSETGEVLLTIDAHSGFANGVAWSPDGTRLVTGGADTVGRVWDSETGALLFTLTGHTRSVDGVAWSPDGQRIATHSGTLTFGPSDLFVDGDGTARVWDAATGAEFFVFQHGDATLDAVWSPDSTQLVTMNDFEEIQTWRVFTTTDALIAYARECCVVRDFTVEERKLYGIE